jgi:hypothetical protein
MPRTMDRRGGIVQEEFSAIGAPRRAVGRGVV